MKRFFNPETGVWRLLGMLADLLLLSMLWVLCSAPLLTLGAATAALYDALVRNFHRDENDYLLRFFQVFKRDLLCGMLPTLFWSLLLYSLVRGYLYIAASLSGSLALLFGAALFVLLLIPIGAACWVFPVLSRFQLGFKALCVNSARLAVAHLPRTLSLAAASCAAVYLTLRLALLPLFVLPALLLLFWSWLMEPVFLHYESQSHPEP